MFGWPGPKIRRVRSRTGLVLALVRYRDDPWQIVYKLALRRALRGCDSVLDLGCGSCPTMRQLGLGRITGLEGYEPAVARARQLGTHDEIVLGDVRRAGELFPPKSFDACVALDLIEHLPKAEGWALLDAMERLARRRVVVFTPSGFLPQGNKEAGDLQVHVSGWEPHELRARGYRVQGMFGPKSLRGEQHRLKYRPKWFWACVALVLHVLWTRHVPEHAAAMLCVKHLD